MPPLEMFNSYVIAKFSFKNDKLTDVDLEVHPFRDFLSSKGAAKDAERVVEIITSKLKSKYAYIKNESSNTISGAHNLLFEGKFSRANLWVNLTEQAHPIISLAITYTPPREKREVEINKRETIAF